MNETVIGIMDSAYFVSKNELLKWVNDTLLLNVTHVEDLGSGSIYCQLIDAYYRHAIPMNKVNWKAKFQYEFMNNLKFFYKGLEKIGAGRKFDVNKLAKARYQDNLETIQWLKRYLEKGSLQDNYSPLQRRNNETFFSHHSQKTSFITKPVKMGQSPSLNSLNFSFKKEVQSNQQNQRGDKVDQIKRILSLKESNDVKIYLIGEVVNSLKEKKGLAEKEVDHNTQDVVNCNKEKKGLSEKEMPEKVVEKEMEKEVEKEMEKVAEKEMEMEKEMEKEMGNHTLEVEQNHALDMQEHHAVEMEVSHNTSKEEAF